ncbi:ester cyclase [Phytophthora cinnamomi]|uniref:ester cyclase n=1 Tax=Phytophthora cinnamomi TaxID=4785 RepID=UPI003559D931|nr:ester cyclase [Phytophthora cinnamomi]
MRASSPLHPLDVVPAAAASSSAGTNVVSGASAATFLPSSALRRSPSCEWREWEETLDSFGASAGLAGVDAAMDVDLDQFLLASADDFLEPFASPNATPDSPIFTADHDFLYEAEQDLHMLQAAGFDPHVGAGVAGELQTLVECKLELQSMPMPQQQQMLPVSTPTAHRHRKRKTAELHRLRGEVDRLARGNAHLVKKAKRQEQHSAAQIAAVKREVEANEQVEKIYRRRYDILHGILEAWNTGGVEDLEEIADNVYDEDVTLISPDYSEGLHGVEAVMSHWNMLLDAFPDGIMEEYIIQREEGSTEKMKATWTFSGTQIFPIFGIQPRHKKVCISGKSFFTFKGDRIRQMVLSWNYRETLLKLMGMQPDKAHGVVLSASASASSAHAMAQAGGVRS